MKSILPSSSKAGLVFEEDQNDTLMTDKPASTSSLNLKWDVNH